MIYSDCGKISIKKYYFRPDKCNNLEQPFQMNYKKLTKMFNNYLIHMNPKSKIIISNYGKT